MRHESQYFTVTRPARTFSSRGKGTSDCVDLVGAMGGDGSRFRGRIPGSRKAWYTSNRSRGSA